jgi:hypothetical protein
MAIKTLRKVRGNEVSRVELGKMYFFRYIPKEADTYHDRYPLIFVTKRRQNWFEGINYHHLILKRRILLFDIMSKYFSDAPVEEDTTLFWRKFRRIMFNMRSLRGAEISFRRYKIISVRSKLIEINPLDWERTLLLSAELFKSESGGKMSSNKIWKQNEKTIRQLKR